MRTLLSLLLLLTFFVPLASTRAGGPAQPEPSCTPAEVRDYLIARKAYLNVGLAVARAYFDGVMDLPSAVFLTGQVAYDLGLLSAPACVQPLPYQTLHILHVMQMLLTCGDRSDCLAVAQHHLQQLTPARDKLLETWYAYAGLDESELADLWPTTPDYLALRRLLQAATQPQPTPGSPT